MKEYVRDKRSPMPSNEHVSEVMSANAGSNTHPEIRLRQALRRAGHIGYRLHRKDLPGRPDIAFIGPKVAIFVNGCFWHRCPICDLPLPKSNTEFWRSKFDANVKRDAEKCNRLRSEGWVVITVWECQIKKDVDEAVRTISSELGRRKSSEISSIEQ